MKVATIQLSINACESKKERIKRVEGIIDQLEGSDLILLPELWNVGFFSFDNYRTESETMQGETVTMLSEKAKKLGAYIFSGSFIEKHNEKLYNASVLIDDKGKIVGHYRKIHLFGYGSKERELLSPGDKIEVVDTSFGKIGLSICYDLRFPELFRRMVDKGAEIILNCAAWPYPRVEHWNILNQVRAIENQCYFLSCSCAGEKFIGRSMVVDPWGTIVSSASERETILKSEIFPENVRKIRSEFTALKDRVLNS